MNKYKICVYAITKNEEKFIDRWYDSIKEVDKIFVLDTGSTDNTVKKLKEKGIIVKQEIIDPWRFDVARNKSLEMVDTDTDICICVDLDEVFEKGFREKLEKIWQKDTTHLRYNYNWSLDQNNKPIVNFYIEKIHSRKNYRWKHPVHEVLEYTGNYPEKFITTDEITVNHYPDNKKSRSSYLPLLELSVKEDPEDDRNMHYLGREYMYYGKYQEAIDTLEKHLNLKSATWKDERCASMRFIGRSYKALKRYKEAEMWYLESIKEAPYLRDGYVETALLYYELGNYEKVYKYCIEARKIEKNRKTYINEIFTFNETVDDLLSISCYYLGNYKDALKHIENAIKINPKDKRLQENKNLIQNKIKET